MAVFAAAVARVLVVVVQRLRHLDRTERGRIQAQAQAAERTRASLDAPGTLPGHPLVVTSAAAVEPKAAAIPCPICGRSRHVDAHETTDVAGRRLRRLTMRCGSCGRRGDLYLRIDMPRVD